MAIDYKGMTEEEIRDCLEEELERAERETIRQINNMGREVRKVCDGVEALGLRFLSGENVFDGVLRLLKAATENKE